jgi:hypothetical protein
MNPKVCIPPTPPIFVLGCQRSGTTWLANILDSSPDLLLFMEPFSAPYGIFPEFPSQFFFSERSSPRLDYLLQKKMPLKLLRYKGMISQRSLYDPKWFKIEKWLCKVGCKSMGMLPHQIKKKLLNFQLLNLNRMDTDLPLYPKNNQPTFWAIKELRFAGKIPVLLSAFPQARFLVIIRHPAATVHSILTWFGRGRLTELRHDLETYLEKIETQPIAAPYKDLIARCRQRGLAHKVALYWRVSYETLLKQLNHNPNTYFLVYEKLASQAEVTVEQLFAKFDIPLSASVKDYLAYSSKTELEEVTAITTVRDSATHYKGWCDKISDDTRHAVEEMTTGSVLLKKFEPFYDC